ncbi:unnamed protein product [Oikopleura dioica]|uniref:Transcription initiation factor TFIID subunit 12 n=1 Tax=Oikopleura dioica TaxID=34765 RepID=E4X9J3_OIKDI|nr:unnamed protein product [Oikopleura dioica]CBY40039.1 unnamed protein product [Oikopleura dioica]
MSQPNQPNQVSQGNIQYVSQNQVNTSIGNVQPVSSTGPTQMVYMANPTTRLVQPGGQMVRIVRPSNYPISRPIQRPYTAQGQSIVSGEETNKLMPKSKMQALARDIEPNSILEDDVMELLHRLAEDFVENVVSGSCALAKHRRCTTLDVQDVKMYLNQQWDLQVPGFTIEDSKHRRNTGEAHKQRMALIRKTLKR